MMGPERKKKKKVEGDEVESTATSEDKSKKKKKKKVKTHDDSTTTMDEMTSESAADRLVRPRSRKRRHADDEEDEEEEEVAGKRDVEVVYNGKMVYTSSDFNRKIHSGQLLVTSLVALEGKDNIRGRHKFRATSFRQPPVIVMCPEVKRGGKHVFVHSIYGVKKKGFSFNIRKWEGGIEHFKKERVNFLAVQKGRGHVTIGKRSYSYEALSVRIKEKRTSPHVTMPIPYKQKFKKLDNLVILASVQVDNGCTTSFCINIREIRNHSFVCNLLATGDYIPDKCTLHVVILGGKKVCSTTSDLEECISENVGGNGAVGKFSEFKPKCKTRPLIFSMCKSDSLVVASPVVSLFKSRTRWNVSTVSKKDKLEGEVHCIGL